MVEQDQKCQNQGTLHLLPWVIWMIWMWIKWLHKSLCWLCLTCIFIALRFLSHFCWWYFGVSFLAHFCYYFKFRNFSQVLLKFMWGLNYFYVFVFNFLLVLEVVSYARKCFLPLDNACSTFLSFIGNIF